MFMGLALGQAELLSHHGCLIWIYLMMRTGYSVGISITLERLIIATNRGGANDMLTFNDFIHSQALVELPIKGM